MVIISFRYSRMIWFTICIVSVGMFLLELLWCCVYRLKLQQLITGFYTELSDSIVRVCKPTSMARDGSSWNRKSQGWTSTSHCEKSLFGGYWHSWFNMTVAICCICASIYVLQLAITKGQNYKDLKDFSSVFNGLPLVPSSPPPLLFDPQVTYPELKLFSYPILDQHREENYNASSFVIF